MVAGYAFQSLGELLISGLGLAVMARYVSPSLRGFLMGVYFLATGLSQYLGSFVATYASVPEGMRNPLQSLPLYTNLFLKLGFVAVIGTIVAAALVPLVKRLPEAGATDEPARASGVTATV
jgi:POT family proton-dependent oligopeptide transporter